MLIDGSSDEPLGRHVAALARNNDVMLDIVAPPFDRMDMPPGRSVSDRLKRMLDIDPDFEVLVVHRDAESESMADRVDEIRGAMSSAHIAWPAVPVIPVRMTEAWLLLDEQGIRDVAGRPSGSARLNLPSPSVVEALPDPKLRLQEALAAAAGHSGRRLRKFQRDFPAHRRQLLDRLDRSGPVSGLQAWRALEVATDRAMAELLAARS